MMRRALLLAIAGCLAGCATELRDIGQAPHLTPVGSGLQPARVADVGPAVRQPPRRVAPNSTWQDASVDLFRDPRAARVGDVVTVKIQIKDKASLDNTSNRSRDAKGALSTSLGYDIGALGVAAAGDGTIDATLAGKTATDSKGAISRSESIDLRVAAVVTDVLPNGNLLVSGTQEVRVNFEVRVLEVAGLVRPRDIATDNTISYDKIAEARISYGGRGRITEVQQPGLGQQVIDTLAPF
jgi:flagellar L-ring protein precursor FlgH